jgi:hypothetical protein
VSRLVTGLPMNHVRFRARLRKKSAKAETRLSRVDIVKVKIEYELRWYLPGVKSGPQHA